MWGAVAVFACIAVSASAGETSAQSAGSRIVSGWEASEGQFPYMLYIRAVSQFGDVSFCGGSIIHARWGLSSAKCTVRRAQLILTGGMVNLNRPRFVIETNSVFSPPQYNEDLHLLSQPHDIALIGFNAELSFDAYVQPVRIQRSGDWDRDYSDVIMTTSGWGTTWTNGPSVENLNWVHLRGVNNFICMLMINSNYLVQESTICAGPYNATSQSICSGDSGVPLTAVDVDGGLTQVGVGSFVAGWGCHVGFPGGFIRPGYYHAWIRETTGINFDWELTVKLDVTHEQTNLGKETPVPNDV